MTSPQEFYTSFQASRAAISTRLDTLSTSQQSTTVDQIAQIAQQIQVERKKLNEATGYLPAYDRRSYESQLQDLESRIDALRSKNAPTKGTFSFKKKTPTSSALSKSSAFTTALKDVSTPMPASSTPTPERPPTLNLTSTSHKILTPTSLSLPSSSSTAPTSTNLTVTSLSHCIVDLLPSSPLTGSHSISIENESDNENPKLTALHIRDVSNSVLLLGHIQGSILAHNLDRCIVVASCHQLRIHSSRNTTFYIHVTSNGIIEDSTSLTFAPYPLSLPLPPEIRQQESKHTSIQDFSHLKPSIPSPNWRLLSPSSSNWTWTDIRTLTHTTTTNPKLRGNEDGDEPKAKIDQLLTQVLPRDQ